jgi:Flp pilus assembly protein TadB
MLIELLTTLTLALGVSWWISALISQRKTALAEMYALLESEEQSEGDIDLLRTKKKYQRRRYLICTLGSLAFVGIRSLVSTPSIPELVIFSGIGALAGELLQSRLAARKLLRERGEMEFHLPLAMERVVMAVSAGLDIVPAMAEASRDSSDPISKSFQRIIELSSRGISVANALESVGKEVSLSSVKHALVHLSLAHKEGGELIRPLRELSDATQLSYQERVEEEIAKLPVKAVLPLVITFTGLIICFLTVPLVQVSSLTQKVSQGSLK